MSQIAHVDGMAGYAEAGEEERKPVDKSEEDLKGYDGVNQAG